MTANILTISDSLVSIDSNGNLAGLDAMRDRVETLNPDAIVHLGNLFRQPSPSDETLQEVRETFEQLADAGIETYLIEGKREAGGQAIDSLVAAGVADKLGAEPTKIGEIALFGIDHVDDGEAFERALDALEPANEYTHNLICVHQQIWPPARKSAATSTAFDVMEGTDVHAGRVVSGGLVESRRWEADDFDFQVAYPGSANPNAVESGETATALQFEVDDDRLATTETPLETTGVNREVDHLASAIEFTPSELEDATTEDLIDIYGLAAKAKQVFDARRKKARDELLSRLDEDGFTEGSAARVRRTTQQRKTLKDETAVTRALDHASIDRDAVTQFDKTAIKERVESGNLDSDEVFDTDERRYIKFEEITDSP